MSSSETNSVVILGAGIIGLSTAYYLSELSPNTTIHLVDTSPTLFASASGKAAGFLARDWFSPALSSLGALSFDLHKSLAAAHDGANQWAYSPSTGLSIADVHASSTGERGEDWLHQGTTRALTASGDAVPAKGAGVPKWLAVGRGLVEAKVEKISDGTSTAQLDPLQLCQFLLKQCTTRNIQIHHPATPTALVTSPSPTTLTGLTILSSTTGLTTTLPFTHLLLTAGVWTPSLFRTLFPTSSTSIPITPLSGHSLVLRSPHWTSPPSAQTATAAAEEGVHAVFTTYPSLNFSPEIFSRSSPHGHGYDLYLAGLNTSSVPIPPLATDVHPIDSELALLLQAAQKLLDEEGEEGKATNFDFEVIQKGFCHRPVTPRGVPVLCALGAKETGLALDEDVDGEGGGKVFVCAGHGPWGISLSLGTGLVLAEMVLGRELSADVSQLGLGL